jgi:hypothetical protein
MPRYSVPAKPIRCPSGSVTVRPRACRVPSGEAHADPRYQIRAVGDDLDPFGLIDEGGDSTLRECCLETLRHRPYPPVGRWSSPVTVALPLMASGANRGSFSMSEEVRASQCRT